MLGDKNRLILAENSLKIRIVAYACLNINSVPLKSGETPTTNCDLRYTRMETYIVCKPFAFKKYRGRDFFIRSDMFTQYERYRFRDMEDLIEQSKEVKELEFLLQWSNLTEEHIAVARELKQVQIPIAFDIVRYKKHLQDMIEAETGERPETGLFYEKEMEIVNDKRVEDDIIKTIENQNGFCRNYRKKCKEAREAKKNKRRASK